MHEYKIQEKLTTKKIEYDLKRNYGQGAVAISVIAVVFSVLFIIPIALIINNDPAKHEGASKYLLIAIPVLLSLMLLLLWGMSVYVVYMRLKGYKKYKIGIDIFTGFEIRQDRGLFIRYKDTTDENEHYDFQYLKLARFGRFAIASKARYYTWSEYYNTTGRRLEDSFRIGERVYVVLVGKRVQCVYNDKMFELSETLMRERLIDDPELHKQQKQAEQEHDE